MAGDWIKMRSNLWDDPRVAAICDKTGNLEASVIGALYWLWATADQHSVDGILPGMSCKSIDRKTGVAGLCEALISVGWIADHPEGVRIVRFEEHNGASAKKRCLTAKRVSNHRSCNEDVTQEELQKDTGSVIGALAREEKRREDVNLPPTSLREVPPSDSSKQKKSSNVTLTQWLVGVRDRGEKIISDYEPLWKFCADTKLPEEFVEIAWIKFRDRYTSDEKAKRKRYTNWRLVFKRAVEENWMKLWFYSEKDQQFRLSTVGVSADLATREAA